MPTVRLSAFDVPLLSACKATVPGRSEPVIAVAFGHDVRSADVFAISIADAHHLQWVLDATLASAPSDPDDEVVDRAHL